MTARLLAFIVVGLLLPTTAARADGLTITESSMSGFPNRSYLLTLPDERAIDPSDVVVEENGRRVDQVAVEAGGRSATMLVIDASNSMRGRAIDGAMAAAREFAEQRRADQLLGVTFFSNAPTVVLEPTTDSADIERVLADPPPLARGTQIHDAVNVAVEEIRNAKVDAGSIVVMSDGDDTGSVLAPSSVVSEAKSSAIRVFGVGLRSRRFEPTALQAISETGEYVEAGSISDLAAVFSELGNRLASEYVVSYMSPSRLGAKVAVSVRVNGIAAPATAAYTAPASPFGGQLPVEPSGWRSAVAAITVAIVVSVLLGFALLIVVRPARKPVRDRISAFVPEEHRGAFSRLADVSAAPVLASADRALERLKPWQNFKLEVELLKLRLSAIRILLGTAVTTLLFTAVWEMLGNTMMAIITLIGLPIGVRGYVGFKVKKLRRRFEDQLPDNLQVLASALRAGHSFVGALNIMVADAPEPSREEYRRVMSDEQIGISVEESLAVVAERMRCEDVIYIGLIATLQQETGGNTAEVLDKVVETMRERAKIRRLVRTLTVQGRMGGWIVTALPIAMVVFLNLARPDYLDPMTETPMGIAILVLAALAVAAGAQCIRRIVDIKV